MAKKVAQLTKVIYLLNTKNDEHDYEISCLETIFESELEMIEKYNKKCLVDLKENMNNRNENSIVKTLSEEITQLKRNHEEEKTQTINKFETLKKKSTENENALKNIAKDKIENLKKEIEEMKTQVNTYI
jgi:hypothetical protein